MLITQNLLLIFDLFVIGEGEEVILELIEAYKSWKNKQEDKEVFLKIAAGIKGIYVPSFIKYIIIVIELLKR